MRTQLARGGIEVLKFWIHINPDEQLKRFKERESTPFKQVPPSRSLPRVVCCSRVVCAQYKLTEEDWRNRAKWESYEAAACDMVQRCSTREAPWVLVEGNDKL